MAGGLIGGGIANVPIPIFQGTGFTLQGRGCAIGGAEAGLDLPLPGVFGNMGVGAAFVGAVFPVGCDVMPDFLDGSILFLPAPHGQGSVAPG